MKQEIINGGNARYLGELERFKDGIPFGIVNKTKTDVGGTYVAANCSSNYIIVCPFKDLVDSIAADKNNRYEIFKCYGGVREYQFRKYIKNNTTYKIAVTYDSLPKLIGWLSSTEGWKVLVDEYHLILEDMDFRYDAINGLMEEIQKFRHYSFLSATPIDLDFEIDFLKQLPHYKVQWNGVTKITPIRYKVTQLTKGLARFIQIFLDEGISLPDINGNVSKVEELYIFINSVTSIKQIADTLKLNPDDVKICCADRIRNNKLLGEYQIESVSSPNKKINFFTKKCFQGCNLFTNNGLIIVASDAYRTQTLVDISTTMEQIAGRIRINDEYQNIFRNVIVHLFSTNKNVMSDEEFEMMMQDKEKEADKLLSGWSKLDKEERQTYIKRMNLDTELVSIINGKMVYNNLKKQSFIYKQELRKTYKDGISIRDSFMQSEKFELTNQNEWEDFNIKLAKAMTVSYEQLLKDYLDSPSESYEQEYPEFPLIKRYLKESEMNTLRWNREKMLKAVEDKKQVNKALLAIYQPGFISNQDLKGKLKDEFGRLGIKLSPKATLIENCTLYSVEKASRKIDGKTVSGYELGKMVFTFE
ncbi:DEAD/DEAH box helicase family protein [Bacteroides thetaiotaomicron]|uniref:DEAD/DEAH box helicase family protein n=1 Tax=Bacteroides thetaiotaomicron TaxID=818 RepID=UPI001F40E63F|nr:DEAD/DEAH box helicase family protein [Bacteroides thetaiotaomicron]MCE8952479.1 DEAD/DEAH box helicase family protein [Bacteroides thetaiotaomicron]MCE8969972.1 DEAD/DEAH box helicase family protein [Bacteroides thetaiotaomicron]